MSAKRMRIACFAAFALLYVGCILGKYLRGPWGPADNLFVAVSALVASLVWAYSQMYRAMYRLGPDALKGWAAGRGLRLVQAERVTGPFERLRLWPWVSNTQMLYRIEAEAPGGLILGGIARVGGYWLPSIRTSGSPVEVRWEVPGPGKNPLNARWPEL